MSGRRQGSLGSGPKGYVDAFLGDKPHKKERFLITKSLERMPTLYQGPSKNGAHNLESLIFEEWHDRTLEGLQRALGGALSTMEPRAIAITPNIVFK